MDLQEIRKALVGKVLKGAMDGREYNVLIGDVIENAADGFALLNMDGKTILSGCSIFLEKLILADHYLCNGLGLWLEDLQQKPQQAKDPLHYSFSPSSKPIDWELRTWNLAVKLYTFSENMTSDASIRYAKELVEEYRKEFNL